RKRDEVARAKNEPESSATVSDRRSRDFGASLRRPGLSVIAEIKRRSPSRGDLRADLDPAAVARVYAQCGAAAISCLTDRHFFGAEPDDLPVAARAVAIPVLRKDFIIDESQIHEARRMGADAVLLIVRILAAAQLSEFLALCRELRMAALVEVHKEN